MHWEWSWYHLTCFHCCPNTFATGIHNSLCSPLYHFLYPKFLARSWAQPRCMWSHHWREAFSPALLGMSWLWRKLLKPLLTKTSSSMEEVSWREAKSAIAQGRPETCYFWDHTAGRASKNPSDQHSKRHLQWRMNLIMKNLFCHYKETKMLLQRQGWGVDYDTPIGRNQLWQQNKGFPAA